MYFQTATSARGFMSNSANVIWFSKLGIDDVPQVGGKNASLGEMISQLKGVGIQVPNGFATTAEAFQKFLAQNDLNNRIYQALADLDVDDVKALAKTGAAIRQWILETPFFPEMEQEVRQAYAQLAAESSSLLSVAVRSSATAEDLPDASFAGQQETFLNVQGIDHVLTAIKAVFASLFNDRAISYRDHQKFAHEDVAISAGIQKMVRSDLGSSGVIFTLDTESGFKEVVFITSAYGLGELVVQGAINPDEFYVHKPTLLADKPAILRRTLGSKRNKMILSQEKGLGDTVKTIAVEEDESQRFSLSNEEIQALAKHAVRIEQHYGRPMDIEWAKDGQDGQLYILQARPETVRSRDHQVLERYCLPKRGEVIAEGRSVGQMIGKGQARVIKSLDQMSQVVPGDVLVADMTDPDWEPVMKRASAIVTNRGGRTCHAAIIARELGIPAVVGCGNATDVIQDGMDITVSCAEGDAGFVYEGLLDFEIKRIDIDNLPNLPLKIMLNVGNPDRAFAFQSLPNEGIGLARLEFIISNTIGIHPKALLNFETLPADLKKTIAQKIYAYGDPVEYYVERLKEGISTLAAAFYPKPVIVRLSDFKSNEYANLLGGNLYEPNEENPMLGFRGASRYVAPEFQDCFALECVALRRVRDDMGLTNVQVMVPFVRTLEEAKAVVEILAENGLERGKNGLKLIMMCEIPSNALLAEEFLQYFDGFSIGSNDLTQLTLGIDRDSAIVAKQFDERDPAVKKLLSQAIRTAKSMNKYVGICGQGPSDHPDFAEWLMKEGIDSVSLNPDSVLETFLFLADKGKPK